MGGDGLRKQLQAGPPPGAYDVHETKSFVHETLSKTGTNVPFATSTGRFRETSKKKIDMMKEPFATSAGRFRESSEERLINFGVGFGL
jgi:hypothetical protein